MVTSKQESREQENPDILGLTCRIKTCPTEIQEKIFEKWAYQSNSYDNTEEWRSKGYCTTYIDKSDNGRVYLEFYRAHIDDWSSLLNFLKFHKEVIIGFDCSLLMNNPWSSLFEIFIAKYVPCTDESLKDADLIIVLQSDLKDAARFNLCFKFAITLESTKVSSLDPKPNHEEPRFQIKSTFSGYPISEEIFLECLQEIPFERCFSYHIMEYGSNLEEDDPNDMIPPTS